MHTPGRIGACHQPEPVELFRVKKKTKSVLSNDSSSANADPRNSNRSEPATKALSEGPKR